MASSEEKMRDSNFAKADVDVAQQAIIENPSIYR